MILSHAVLDGRLRQGHEVPVQQGVLREAVHVRALE